MEYAYLFFTNSRKSCVIEFVALLPSVLVVICEQIHILREAPLFSLIGEGKSPMLIICSLKVTSIVFGVLTVVHGVWILGELLSGVKVN